jgi:hypothetical protein
VTGVDTNRVKTHREFHSLGDDWQPVSGYPTTITQLVLSDNLDAATGTGSRTRLVRWQAGTLLPAPVVHDYTEEVLVIEGDLVVGCDASGAGGEVFEPYSYACRPPRTPHGPFTTRTGCLMLEIDSYG